MAFLSPQRRIADGQFTQTIYGFIKEQKFSEAIAALQAELQVCISWVGTGLI
jgi:hypothetical protein